MWTREEAPPRIGGPDSRRLTQRKWELFRFPAVYTGLSNVAINAILVTAAKRRFFALSESGIRNISREGVYPRKAPHPAPPTRVFFRTELRTRASLPLSIPILA